MSRAPVEAAEPAPVDLPARRMACAVRGPHAPIIAALITRRRDLGWSLDELSERVGCERALLGRWEIGDKVPGARNLAEWAQALGCVVVVVAVDRLVSPEGASGRSVEGQAWQAP